MCMYVYVCGVCSTCTVFSLIICDVVRGNGMVRWLLGKVAGKGKVKGKVALGWNCKAKVRGEGKVKVRWMVRVR